MTLPLEATVISLQTWLSQNRRRVRQIGLALSAVLFAVGLLLAFRAAPDILQKIDPIPFILLFGLSALVQPLLNAAEFRVMVAYGGHEIGWKKALEISLYTSASNLLPLPGGAITRLAAMRSYGISMRTATLIIALMLAVWGGLAFFYSGMWLLITHQLYLGTTFGLIGLIVLGLTAFACWRLRADASLLIAGFIVRIALLMLDAGRLAFAILALGTEADFSQASVLVLSTFIGAVVAVAPSGLGVREATMALLSPFAGVPPAIGFLAATVNRIAGILGLMALAAWVAIFPHAAPHVASNSSAGSEKQK